MVARGSILKCEVSPTCWKPVILPLSRALVYPNPNRSHFESMDIWHTCQRKDANRTDGWLGRFLESSAKFDVSDPAGFHLGEDKQPFALMSREVRVPSIRSLEEFRLNGSDSKQFGNAIKELADARRDSSNDLLGFVQSSTSSAISASERITSAGMSQQTSGNYPDNASFEKAAGGLAVDSFRADDSGLLCPDQRIRHTRSTGKCAPDTRSCGERFRQHVCRRK